MFRLISSLLLVVLIVGCAPATFQALREKPGGQAKFEVDQNYQRVYRTVLANSRKCWQAGMITAQMVVQGDLYSDVRTGEVTVALHGGAGIDTYLGIDIKALSDERTEVQTFYALSSWAQGTRIVEAWVKEGATECRVTR